VDLWTTQARCPQGPQPQQTQKRSLSPINFEARNSNGPADGHDCRQTTHRFLRGGCKINAERQAILPRSICSERRVHLIFNSRWTGAALKSIHRRYSGRPVGRTSRMCVGRGGATPLNVKPTPRAKQVAQGQGPAGELRVVFCGYGVAVVILDRNVLCRRYSNHSRQQELRADRR
jgi:hypothetical protein